MWEIGWIDDFGEWIVSDDLDSAAREDVRAALMVLRELGPTLGHPLADTLKGSKHANMKELRVQSRGRPFRILYAFDPDRKAVLLIGGNKQGKKRFYEQLIPIADRLFGEYLQELENAKAKQKSPKRL